MNAHSRWIMAKRYFLVLGVFSVLLFGGGAGAQDDGSRIRVNVVLVQLNVAVTDRKGHYVSGLRPEDFEIIEDNIPEKLATFEEGNEPQRRLINIAPDSGHPAQGSGKVSKMGGAEPADDQSRTQASPANGANVFILFDTSNYMYRGFVFAQDAIADFVRSLETADKLALYSYSRDLSRETQLTADRSQVLRGVRSTVAGDDAALYNCLLMTVRDAGQNEGRKVVVVFSNGPDNASMVPPEDVAELAQSKGIPIYMVSTREAKLEPVSSTVFKRMSSATGGEAYFAKTWREQQKAFASIRNDLAHLYSLSYYPQPNPNRGWRTITVKLKGERARKCRIRTRNGYRPESTRVSAERTVPPAVMESAPASSN